MLNRRTLLAASAATLAAPRVLRAQSTPGVTANEIKIGNIMPYSGPARRRRKPAKPVGRTKRNRIRMTP